jgi:2-(1,2-epoxy-1,2-dihydrophenyl)acetyl-CoA isomerase
VEGSVKSEGLRLERDGAIATLVFDRPEARNAFTPEMSLAFGARLRELRDDESLRVLVLTGAGDAFSSGADVKAMGSPDRLGRPPEVGYERVKAAGLRTLELAEFPRPTIAAVNGPVAGFALALAFACDVVIAAERARFSFGFSRIGYVPDAGLCWILPRLVGLARAKELFFRAATIDARGAERLGLVSRVVADSALAAETRALAEEIAARPAAALRFGKAILDRAHESDFRTVVEQEAYAQGILGTTEEHKAAVRAFLEKKT